MGVTTSVQVVPTTCSKKDKEKHDSQSHSGASRIGDQRPCTVGKKRSWRGHESFPSTAPRLLVGIPDQKWHPESKGKIEFVLNKPRRRPSLALEAT